MPLKYPRSLYPAKCPSGMKTHQELAEGSLAHQVPSKPSQKPMLEPPQKKRQYYYMKTEWEESNNKNKYLAIDNSC